VEIPVEPPVFVETYAGHCSFAWRADDLGRFLDAVDATASIPAAATPVVDAADTAGRERRALSEIDPEDTTYVRLDPPRPWTLSWEARTRDVVSLTGTPVPSICRAFHTATTDCAAWPTECLERVAELTGFWE
jgi:hypothetical protein